MSEQTRKAKEKAKEAIINIENCWNWDALDCLIEAQKELIQEDT